MKSTSAWDWWNGAVDWATPAGQLLQQFFALLPKNRLYRFAVFGSAPLQLTLDGTWLSADVDLYSEDDEDLSDLIRRTGLDKERGRLYIEPGFALSFRTSPLMRSRAKIEVQESVSVLIPHPVDILIGKLDRLDEKDLLAFRRVTELTGHPTSDEFKRELQNAVDLFRPAFDEESPNRYPENTRRLWHELWNAQIDIRREIVEPALARRRQGYGEPPPPYKRALCD